jgi:hypothetical protein
MIALLLTFFIVLCIVGVILWGVNQIPGIPPVVKVVVYVLVAVVLLVVCLNYVQGGGLGSGMHLSGH